MLFESYWFHIHDVEENLRRICMLIGAHTFQNVHTPRLGGICKHIISQFPKKDLGLFLDFYVSEDKQYWFLGLRDTSEKPEIMKMKGVRFLR